MGAGYLHDKKVLNVHQKELLVCVLDALYIAILQTYVSNRRDLINWQMIIGPILLAYQTGRTEFLQCSLVIGRVLPSERANHKLETGIIPEALIGLQVVPVGQ